MQGYSLNLKQLSKIKHLKQQHHELKQIMNQLTNLTAKSRQILKSTQQNSSSLKLNSTAFSSPEIVELTQLEQKIEQFQNDLNKFKLKMVQRKNQIKCKIIQEEKNKKQDQILFRAVLENYEEKLSQLQRIVLQRESQIQKLQKNKREKKKIVTDAKILSVDYASLKLFQEQYQQKQIYQNLSKQTVQIKSNINHIIKQTKKHQNLALKFKLAKQTKMPFYKFTDIIKNGIQRFSESDFKIYQLIQSNNKNSDQNTILKKLNNQNDINLIIKKQKMNSFLLEKLILREQQKQKQFKSKNNLLKEAINLKQERSIYKQLQSLIQKNRNYFRLSKWKSFSQKGGSQKVKPEKLHIRKSEYQTYLEYLRTQIKNIPQITKSKKYPFKSKSVEKNIQTWGENQEKFLEQSRRSYQFNQFQQIFSPTLQYMKKQSINVGQYFI